MRKFFTFIAAVLFAGSMMAEDGLVYTLKYANAAGGGNTYANTYDVTVDGIGWNVPGNTTTDPARIGGKSLDGVDRALFSKDPITNNISKIEIEHGTSNITVNSMKVIVASDATFETVISTLTPTFAANSVVSALRPDGVDWSNAYYKIIYNLTETSGSNKYFQFVEARFIGEGGSAIEVPDTLKVNVAEAIAAGVKLDSAATSFDVYEVTGFVVNAQEYSTQYNNQDWNMVDDTTAAALEPEFKAFRAVLTPDGNDVKVINGDKVMVKGKLTKYWDKNTSKFIIEIANGSAVYVEKADGDHTLPAPPVVDTVVVSVDSALAIGASLKDNDVTTSYYDITGYVSFIAKRYDGSSENFWITAEKGSEASSNADGAFYVFSGKPTNNQELGLGAKVRIITTIYKYVKNSTVTIENKAAVDVEVLEQGELVIDTLTIEEAVVEALKLDSGVTGAKFYAVKGFIHKVKDAFNKQYKNASFYLSEMENYQQTDPDILCYRASVALADSAKVKVGSYVIVTGQLQHFGKDGQIVSGVTVFTDAPKVDTIPVTVAEAVEIAEKLADNTATADLYKVTGFVVNPTEMEDDEDTQNFYLAAEAGGEKALYAWNARIAYPGVAAGDKVALIGRLKKDVNGDKTTIQIEQGLVEIIEKQGIENIVLTEKAKKVVVDGVVYVIRDNKMFNVLGTQVR